MAFYDDLQVATEETKNYLLSAPVIAAVYEGRFDEATYIAFLNQAYHHVKHTIPLLMAAGTRTPERLSWFRKTLAVYIQEEIGHEEWILDDLEAMGCDREEYRKSSEPFHINNMVAYLYDYVNRKNPIGILGMVQVLEGTSASMAPEVARRVQAKLKLPDHAMIYLTTHGELDQEHIRYFRTAVNKLDNDTDRNAVAEVANHVYRLYGDVYRSLPLPEVNTQLKAVS